MSVEYESLIEQLKETLALLYGNIRKDKETDEVNDFGMFMNVFVYDIEENARMHVFG